MTVVSFRALSRASASPWGMMVPVATPVMVAFGADEQQEADGKDGGSSGWKIPTGLTLLALAVFCYQQCNHARHSKVLADSFNTRDLTYYEPDTNGSRGSAFLGAPNLDTPYIYEYHPKAGDDTGRVYQAPAGDTPPDNTGGAASSDHEADIPDAAAPASGQQSGKAKASTPAASGTTGGINKVYQLLDGWVKAEKAKRNKTDETVLHDRLHTLADLIYPHYKENTYTYTLDNKLAKSYGIQDKIELVCRMCFKADKKALPGDIGVTLKGTQATVSHNYPRPY